MANSALTRSAISGHRQLPPGPFPHDVQIAFERADLSSDRQWFQDHWNTWQEQMVMHALASYPVFEWAAFRAWLAEEKPSEWVTLQQKFDNAVSDGSEQMLLEDDAESGCESGSLNASEAFTEGSSSEDEDKGTDSDLGRNLKQSSSH